MNIYHVPKDPLMRLFFHRDITKNNPPRGGPLPEFLALKQESRILGHSSNPVCGFSMMEQARLCAVRPVENWLGSSLTRYRVEPLSENLTLVL